MIPEKLKQTDQCLIELLRDRLSLLSASKIPAEEQLAQVRPLLASAGLPESIWTNLVNSCQAAISTDTSLSMAHKAIPRNITIIGGRGRMGRFFTQQLTAAGHNVSILENEDWEYADQLLGSAELVIVCVPIKWTVDVIKRASQYLAPTTALCDITSLKTEPVQAMLEYHRGPVMGLHPMFGPNVKSFAQEKVVACPGRKDDSFEWLLDFIKSQGGEVIVSTPEEHDYMMVIIQATRHFSRFSVGVFLAQEGIDIERSLSMSSPSYRQEIDIIKRLFAQSPHLCVDIMLATQDRCQAIAKLADTYNRLARLVARKDRAALIEEFENAQSFFSEENISSPKLSQENHADRHLSRYRMPVVPNRS
ncbi:prephenate dehydrogenase [Scytonema sp. HK-05]|uniref:bifunctional chorismate mutase/prephenate dehydrogenase n=1 Tax=Scytonema sp. HK-05 TaxID=1137095 RepID=UPI0009360D20|nr:bifunctional chorismate mutase/prephenate dehydrogenase [Scytonema sp. HK-05]OKH61039.1 chorismate mutase [Scytonema sp. HK-05]BAY46432.1 prephenate dehydrogenase [Scytonema sp. HK-05]